MKTLDHNAAYLSQEMNRDVVTDYLHRHDLLTADQYQLAKGESDDNDDTESNDHGGNNDHDDKNDTDDNENDHGK